MRAYPPVHAHNTHTHTHTCMHACMIVSVWHTHAHIHTLARALTLQALPEPTLAKYEDPDSNFSFGFKRGGERIAGGQFDTHKGSFYANPSMDDQAELTDRQRQLKLEYPALYGRNIWPRAHLPDLEKYLRSLSTTMLTTGLRMLALCDRCVADPAPCPWVLGLRGFRA